ncbi:MAG TPA: protease modulator HflK, partial [Burkholderiales bacterium]|nr:protease modulator HflK [Burkholderiales bacterium]
MALNDPQWGRRGSQGPPDLDDVWRRFNEKLNALFGRGRVPGGGPGSVAPKQFGGGLGLLIALVLLIWLASGFYIVDASQRGVVLRFGKYLETTQPGPRWHLPYPIESVEVVNLSQVRTVEVGYRNNVRSKVLKESLMLTDDENIIDIQFAVQYILSSAEDYIFNNRNPKDAVMQAAETAFREVVGKSKMDVTLYEARAQVEAASKKLMQEILDRYKTGVSI